MSANTSAMALSLRFISFKVKRDQALIVHIAGAPFTNMD